MIWTIARREFLDYLKSTRFLIGFTITLVLVMVCTAINVNDYQERRWDYTAAQDEIKSDGFNMQVFRPPEVLSPLVQGKDRMLGSRLQMTYLDIPSRTTGYIGEGASQHHRYAAGFATVDFAFIVRIILSLLVIFLVYNAVAGEKSQGTLRLIAANPVPRHVILAGKSIGGLSVVFLTLLASAIAASLILAVSPAVQLRSPEWTRIGLMVLVSALYLGGFFCLGLFVSVRVNRPSIALTVMLQLWIVLNILYPNLAMMAAEQWYILPTPEEIQARKEAAFQPFRVEWMEARQAFEGAFQRGEPPTPEARLRSFEMAAKRTEIFNRVDREYANELSRQVAVARWIAALSPAAVYNDVMTRLASTGIDQFQRFMDAVVDLWHRYVDLSRRIMEHPEVRPTVKQPRIDFVPEPVGDSFAAVAAPIAILCIFNALWFMLAYTGFLRKDVR